MVETALVMPLYMLIILGLLFFGYSTLNRQREVKATQFAAWTPGEQSADELMASHWPSGGGQTSGGPAAPGWTTATRGDLKLSVGEYASESDDYYGYEIRSQLSGSLLGGGQADTFDRERLAVSLWNYALGETTQSFVWDPVNGAVEQTRTHYDSIARYLNNRADPNGSGGGGFVEADDQCPPTITPSVGWIALALDGPGAYHWLERRHADLEGEYVPPYFRMIFEESGQPPSDFTTYVTLNYPTPSYRPISKFTVDLTGRGAGVRLAAGEGNTSSDQLLLEAANTFGTALTPVDDATRDLWRRW